MEINNKMQTEDFDIKKFELNSIGKVYEFTREDGTEVMQMEFPGGYSEAESFPKPTFYKIHKVYYPNGKIREIGPVLGNLSIGVWRYYDENGKETIVDEDEKYGKPNYNDILVFLDKKGYIDLHTGERREKISIGYEPEKKVWTVYVDHFNGENYEYIFDKKGKNISHRTYTLAE